MADKGRALMPGAEDSRRLGAILEALEDIAAGQLDRRAPVSPAHDEIDAVAYTVNVLVGELRLTVDQLARAERDAHKASEQKSMFLRNLSHELRTPLSAILSYVDLLTRTKLDAQQRDAVDCIRTNSDALRHLAEDLLDLARIEAGKLQLTRGLVSPAIVVSDVVQSLSLQAAAKGVALDVSMSEDLPRELVTDSQRLRQILMNLVGNAIKFTDAGHIAVSLRVHDEGRTLVVDIADTGIGLSDADQQRLFTAFLQTDAGRGGVGLGLVLAQQLSRQLGGDLTLVSSKLGEGSRFRLQLAIDRGGSHQRTPVPVHQVTNLDGLSVLLAEDNVDILEPYALLLESVGCEVKKATGGGEAIDLATAHPFDVILMDMQMPGIDGMEATLRLRQSGYERPIVALSSYGMPEDRRRFLDAGCNELITKPIDFDHLVSRIAAYRRPP